jgi:hypothetical protein
VIIFITASAGTGQAGAMVSWRSLEVTCTKSMGTWDKLTAGIGPTTESLMQVHWLMARATGCRHERTLIAGGRDKGRDLVPCVRVAVTAFSRIAAWWRSSFRRWDRTPTRLDPFLPVLDNKEETRFRFMRDQAQRVTKVLVRTDGADPELIWPRAPCRCGSVKRRSRSRPNNCSHPQNPRSSE